MSANSFEIDLGGVPDRLNEVADGIRDLSELMSEFQEILLSDASAHAEIDMDHFGFAITDGR